MASIASTAMRRFILRPEVGTAAVRHVTATTTTTPFFRALSTTSIRPATIDEKNTPRRPLAPEKKEELREAMMAELRELGVGELEGAEFKIEPMRRVGEDEKTMRARLTYQSRKRGTLESDLLLSTFADEYLPRMSRDEMAQYDQFLDENDWDIYYWATQDAPSSSSPSSPSSPSADPAAQQQQQEEDTRVAPSEQAIAATAAAAAASSEPYRKPGEGEWAQTVGTFKAAYRPVPQRWRDSDILARLREHVRARSEEGKGGMAFMPKLKM